MSGRESIWGIRLVTFCVLINETMGVKLSRLSEMFAKCNAPKLIGRWLLSNQEERVRWNRIRTCTGCEWQRQENKFLALWRWLGNRYLVCVCLNDEICIIRIYVGVTIKQCAEQHQKLKATVLSAQRDYWYACLNRGSEEVSYFGCGSFHGLEKRDSENENLISINRTLLCRWN